MRTGTTATKGKTPHSKLLPLKGERLKVAMLSVHSSPVGALGTSDTGGMSVCIREFARALALRGHQVDVFTRHCKQDPEEPLMLYENVRLVYLRAGDNGRMKKSSLYPYLVDFYLALEEFRNRQGLHYDLIHSHYWLSGRVGNWAQESWGIPNVITFHTVGAAKNDIPGVEREPELRLATERYLARDCQRILSGTDREKSQLLQYYGALPGSIGVVPCGVNLSLFRPMDRSEARNRLNLDQDACVVLYVGRFAPSKGPDRLIEAMAHLRKKRRIKLIMVGGDGVNSREVGNLQTLSRELSLQDRVSFVGRVEQEALPAYYSAADILAVPSRYESFGLVAFESLACGTPVVSTRVGAIENVIQDGVTGRVVENGSPRLLAEGIDGFLSRSSRPSPASIRASVLGYGWASVAAKMVEEYGIAIKQYESAAHSQGSRDCVWPN